jgi:hypothetical protein
MSSFFGLASSKDRKLESLEKIIFWTCKNGNFFSQAIHILVLQVFGLANLQKRNMDFGIDIDLQVHLDQTLKNIVNFNDGHTIKSHSCRLQQMANWFFINFLMNDIPSLIHILKKVNR